MNSLIEEALDKQALISAIKTFSDKHDKHEIPSQNYRYRDLIPSSKPGFGQQYAFEVDMDKCTGCKACVTACHNENGLDPDETWRTVGMIQGGDDNQSTIQHVTSACHHCVDPACLKGCPTLAYKKDEATGIVQHLDDQCFGCQYCILKCPYDVPKYNSKRGIVHKCDMCIGRLTDGQAPACARACPNGAIRITIVDQKDAVEHPEDFVKIPDAPVSTYTRPTTRYVTQKQFPENMVATDHYDIQPEHSHFPLVIMLTLTQLSVGTFWINAITHHLMKFDMNPVFHTPFALILGLVALTASLFHLGRPHLAFRAILGIRTSWLSREILTFGMFTKAAILFAACQLWPGLNQWLSQWVGGLNPKNILEPVVLVSGALGVFSSIMVYRDTKRPFWDRISTTLKFTFTGLILGLGSMILTTNLLMMFESKPDQLILLKNHIHFLVYGMGASLLVKVLIEVSIFYELTKKVITPLQKSALLMKGILKPYMQARHICALLGGVVLPFFLLNLNTVTLKGSAMFMSICIFVLVLVGEILERYVFFRAAIPLKMPSRSQA